MDTLEIIGQKAKAASRKSAKLASKIKDEALIKAADALILNQDTILAANDIDVAHGIENNMPSGLIDRLKLTPERIEQIAKGMKEVSILQDPIGEVDHMVKRPNGLMIGKKRVPLGVVGVIYEARPNVTADVFALTFKTGNAAILKGGKDAFYSNQAIVKTIQEALTKMGVDANTLQLIEDNSRETTTRFMKMREYVDVLIPRGGAGLIQSVVKNATIPVIETGVGNCHIYVDESADLDMAVNIIYNAKTQRIGVCNAMESLVVHENILESLLPKLTKKLQEKSVEMHCDKSSLPFVEGGIQADAADWGKEYLDYILSVKTVSSLDEAIEHINTYSTGHSEAIITENYANAMRFLDEIDSAAVYVNASTRFTDGFEFGFGAEIGISTQKLHARGPMGLEALTSTKFVIFGNGQVRQ